LQKTRLPSNQAPAHHHHREARNSGWGARVYVKTELGIECAVEQSGVP
jgi:hypothetical protein